MTDLPPLIPASVDVVFPSIGNASSDAPEFVVNVTLASLGLSQFDSTLSVNANAVYVLQRAEQAVWSAHSVTNSAALTTLAQQAATDWYLWQLAKIDMSFAGIEAWTPEGTSDYVEWTHGMGTDGLPMVSTRVQRGAFYTYLENLTPPTPPGSTITVTDGTITFVTNILQFPGGTISQPGGPGTPVLYSPGEHDLNAWKASGNWYTINNSEGLIDFNPNALITYAVPVIITNPFAFTDLGFFLYPDPGGGAYNVNGRLSLFSAASFATITPVNLVVGPASMTFLGWPGGMKGTGLAATIPPGLYWILVAFDASGLNMQAASSTVSPLPMVFDGTRMVQAKHLEKSTAFPPAFPGGIGLGDFQIDPTIALAWKF